MIETEKIDNYIRIYSKGFRNKMVLDHSTLTIHVSTKSTILSVPLAIVTIEERKSCSVKFRCAMFAYTVNGRFFISDFSRAKRCL